MRKIVTINIIGLLCLLFTTLLFADESTNNICIAPNTYTKKLPKETIAQELGWVQTNENRCGGYYLEPTFIEPSDAIKNNLIEVTGNQGTFSLHGTSIYEGKVTITQSGQQIIANKAYLYRNPTTEKYSSIDLIGDVILRQPNDLVLAKCGHMDFDTKNKSLRDILYRTAIYSKAKPKPQIQLTNAQIQHENKVYQLSARGSASLFQQTDPKIFTFQNASYTTCPPLNPVWELRAKDIELNKYTGRGVAKHASLTVKGVPVLYAPYFNFPIDSRRQTGFLWPSVGSSSTSGPFIATPYYWNLAPNYDTTITPAFLSKRGLQLNDLFRYLTPSSYGEMNVTILPGDRQFMDFKQDQKEINEGSTNPTIQSELNTLEKASNTRKALSWQDKTYLNDHWSADVDYNYVGDDYYLNDFRNNLNEVTTNQLLQEAELNYKSQYWHLTGRVQGYQTLHPIDSANTFYNQYSRLPQIILDGDYPDSHTGINYFIQNDFSYFDIRNNPGQFPIPTVPVPVGNRLNVQPGLNLPVYRPAFFINPRFQVAMTQYDINNVVEGIPTQPKRAVPIFDVSTGLYFDRDIIFLKHHLQQTLEPQIYYTYIPYHNQNNLPIFDTTLNTLTYDQLFTYNRFSGLDRIGDANQISMGLATRFIDQDSGFQKIYAGIGQIVYFENRRVMLCSNAGTSGTFTYPCPDTLDDDDTVNRSPLSGVLSYNLTPNWSLTSNTIWDTLEKQIDNETFTIGYSRDNLHIINLSYTYVRQEDTIQTTIPDGTSTDYLAQTDLSFTWPLSRDWSTIGRWTQNWNTSHMQNLLYGLQYDSCCWAVRFVAGKIFTNLTPNNTRVYDNEFYLEFALKGLGNFGTGNPGKVINSGVTAYQTNFGQDF